MAASLQSHQDTPEKDTGALLRLISDTLMSADRALKESFLVMMVSLPRYVFVPGKRHQLNSQVIGFHTIKSPRAIQQCQLLTLL